MGIVIETNESIILVIVLIFDTKVAWQCMIKFHYLSSLVALVVGYFNFLKGYFARHPVSSSGRRVRMDILEHLFTMCL